MGIPESRSECGWDREWDPIHAGLGRQIGEDLVAAEVVDMGWWRGWLGDRSLPELELVKRDGESQPKMERRMGPQPIWVGLLLGVIPTPCAGDRGSARG